MLKQSGTADPQAAMDEILSAITEEGTGPGDSITARKYRLPVFIAISVGLFSQLTGINAVLCYLNEIFAPAGASKLSGNLQAIAVAPPISPPRSSPCRSSTRGVPQPAAGPGPEPRREQALNLERPHLARLSPYDHSLDRLPFYFFAAMMVLDLVLVVMLYPERAGVSLEDMQHAIVK